MAENTESRQANKRLFTDFFDHDPGVQKGTPYIKKIQDLITKNDQRLLIDLADIRAFDNQLARSIIRHPADHILALEDALEDTIRSINGKHLQEGQHVRVGFEGQFGFHRVTPRELLSPFLSTLVAVEGIVTKCSLVRPKVVTSVHYCPTTAKFEKREYRDVTSISGLPTGAVYPTRDDEGNLLQTEFGLCSYKDHQTLSIQEMPENAPPGQLPRSIDVIVEDDLVDACKPGDRVQVVGIYKAVPVRTVGSTSGVFRTVLVSNNILQLSKDSRRQAASEKDKETFKEIAAREDAFQLLSESLAPSIYGHSAIKKAILLLMLGGVEKNLPNGTHLRGDINIMMVGDPSVAKSQVLRAVMNLAPLAISTTGRGSSGVGLTAAVTTDQETGERRLEAGAMVLADRGVVCIDEFDKMSDLDRVAIHEVMEQQTVTIAKAGIHASLNARCSVVAAANPIYGNYDHSLTPTKNIGLPDSLLSRFDLLFIVLDRMDAETDRKISEHVLRMHRYRPAGENGGATGVEVSFKQGEEDDENTNRIFVKYDRLLHGEKSKRDGKPEPVTSSFLKKFIHYTKKYTPVITEEAADAIAKTYAAMRGASAANARNGGGTLPITARTLETIIRLSTAHAKLKLRQDDLKDKVLEEDVNVAVDLMKFAIYHEELTEMDKEEKKRKAGDGDAAAGAREGGDDDDDNGDGGDGGPPGTGRRTRARSMDGTPAHTPATGRYQTRASAAATPATGPGVGSSADPNGTNRHAAADSVEEEDEGEPLLRRRRGRGRDAATPSQATPATPAPPPPNDVQTPAPAPMEVEEEAPTPHIPAERREAFQTALSRHHREFRQEVLQVADFTGYINANNANPFTHLELDTLLKEMEADNRIMYTGGTIHFL